MSDDLSKDLDIYLQNMKKESKKPGWLGISVMLFICCLLFIGFIKLQGIVGVVMLLLAFFILLMIIGSFMIK